MSLNKSNGLRQVAKLRCRQLRKEQTPAEEYLWIVLRNRSFLGLKFNRQFTFFSNWMGGRVSSSLIFTVMNFVSSSNLMVRCMEHGARKMRFAMKFSMAMVTPSSVSTITLCLKT